MWLRGKRLHPLFGGIQGGARGGGAGRDLFGFCNKKRLRTLKSTFRVYCARQAAGGFPGPVIFLGTVRKRSRSLRRKRPTCSFRQEEPCLVALRTFHLFSPFSPRYPCLARKAGTGASRLGSLPLEQRSA